MISSHSTFSEVCQSTLLDLRKALDNKRITSIDILLAYWLQIQKSDPEIHAFITTATWDELEKQAQAADERRTKSKPLGFWDGLPIAVKDNICTQGMRTTCGSRMLENFVPPYNAHVIEEIRRQGGIILGKTNMDEFAMGSSTENSAWFATRNPHNLDCTPGGSSGGSAAAVAAGMAPLALGSDTGGSIRQPAAFTGVVGLKPTYGRVSRRGLVAFASSLDQIGPIGKSVSDVAAALTTLAVPDVEDSTCANKTTPNYLEQLSSPINIERMMLNAKIGIPEEYFENAQADVNFDTEVATTMEDVLHQLEKMGAKLCRIRLPYTQYALATYYLIATAEASANLARYDGVRYGTRTHEEVSSLDQMYLQSRSENLGWEVKRRILLGTYCLSQGYYDEYYTKACQVRIAIRQEIDDAFKEVDFLITPTSPIPAFPLGTKRDPLAMYLCDVFTVPFSLSGHPALSIPCGYTSEHLPVGLQIVTKHFEETQLLMYAAVIEKMHQFPL